VFPLRDNISSSRFPLVNYLIIAANLLVFFKEAKLAQAGLFEPFLLSHGLIPKVFLAAPLQEAPKIFMSMFMHGSWGHVLGNMWFLYIFGDNVEDAMGPIRYLFYYLLVGSGAAAAQIYMNPASTLPMVGASGAIAGVLGGYFLLYPGARVLTFFVFVIFVRLIEIPAYFYLGLWFLAQAVNGIGSLSQSHLRGEMGGIAWWAHAGGFASGFALVYPFKRRSRR